MTYLLYTSISHSFFNQLVTYCNGTLISYGYTLLLKIYTNLAVLLDLHSYCSKYAFNKYLFVAARGYFISLLNIGRYIWLLILL